MRAIHLTQHGGVENLKLVNDAPKPEPKTTDVLIRVKASTINQVELVMRRGYPGLALPLPHVPGGDVAGVVEETGSNVSGLQAGQRVVVYPIIPCHNCQLCEDGSPNLCLNWKYIGMHTPGGWADYISVPAENAIPIPDNVSFEEATTIPVAGLTAFHALHTVAGLRDGQTFFIWGGSGGLGTFAVQIARQLGATVIATGSTDEKLQVMRELGAHHVFNRLTDDVFAEIRKIAPDGVDVILNYVGPEAFQPSFDLLKKGGQMLLCGIITGREHMLNLHMTYLRHLSIKGLYLGTMDEMKELLEWTAAGRVKPVIHKTLPLDQAAEAHRILESGNFIGKTILTT